MPFVVEITETPDGPRAHYAGDQRGSTFRPIDVELVDMIAGKMDVYQSKPYALSS